MAYLEKRGENSWRIEVDLGADPLTGKRKRIRRTFQAAGLREAEKKAVQIEAEIRKQGFVDSKNMTVGEYLLFWLESHSPNISDGSTDKYGDVVRCHIIPGIGHMKLSKLEPMHIQRYYSDQLKHGNVKTGEGLCKRSVKLHHTVLKNALNYAVKPLNLISSNPSEDVVPPRFEDEEMTALTASELAILIKSAKKLFYDNPLNLSYYGIIVTAAYTGMRIGEVLGISWKNVDLEHNIIHVKQAVKRDKINQVAIGRLKTKNSYRSVNISDDVASVLKAIKTQQKKSKLMLGTEYNNPYDLVFTLLKGSIIRFPYVWKKFKMVQKDCSLDLRFHDLRHTHITLLLQAGTNPKVVAERVGDTVETILRVYAHVLPNMQKEAAAKFDSLMELVQL